MHQVTFFREPVLVLTVNLAEHRSKAYYSRSVETGLALLLRCPELRLLTMSILLYN